MAAGTDEEDQQGLRVTMDVEGEVSQAGDCHARLPGRQELESIQEAPM